MGRKRRLEQYLARRRQNQDAALEEGTRISNRLFRLGVGSVLVLIMVLLASSPYERTPTFMIGAAILIVLAAALSAACLNRVQHQLFERPSTFNQFVVLLLLLLGAHRFIAAMGWSPFLTPLPLFAMIFAMLFSQGTAILLGLVLATFLAVFGPWELSGAARSLPLLFGLGLGSTTAVLGMRRIRRQTRPVIVGAYAGLTQAAVLLAFTLMGASGELRDVDFTALTEEQAQVLWREPAWAFAGGLFSGAILTCLLPAVERMLGLLTDRRLLDLADPSNDLLRVLSEQAPGTYQHTLGVSTLASSAAGAIGADSLLARVGAYYHDIGKIKTPHYFVENMGEDKSIHERLRPSISKMIIISHVKEGILLAKDEGLPQKIIDMIPMHHGTTVVEYFFHKAKRTTDPNLAGEPGDVEYRYPGPKPRFKEAGILMLADSVEARAKVESHPNPNRFRVMVHEEIQKRLLDGQLDESDLTLNDLRVVEDSFVRQLTTMYHGRIKYPGPEREARSPKRSRTPDEPGAGGDKPAPDAEPRANGADEPPKRRRDRKAKDANDAPEEGDEGERGAATGRPREKSEVRSL